MPGLKSSWSLHRRQKAIGKERETMAQMKRKRLKKWILAAAILLLLYKMYPLFDHPKYIVFFN